MRFGWLLVVASCSCGAPARARAPAPAAVTPPATAPAPSPTPAGRRSEPAICTDVTPPYPAWTVSERAVRDASTSFTSAVRADNELPIGKAAIAWALYLNAIHARLHVVFSDTYLASLCALDRKDPLNDPTLVARIELAIGRDGALEQVGVVKRSGQPSFDAAAVESFERIAPLPVPEPAVRSEDGRAHLQWEFRRDQIFACSTMHVRPYILDFSERGSAASPP